MINSTNFNKSFTPNFTANYKILVVDDNDWHRELIINNLEEIPLPKGDTLDIAESETVSEALQLIEENKTPIGNNLDIVLSDGYIDEENMTNPDGLIVATAAKDAGIKNIAIISGADAIKDTIVNNKFNFVPKANAALPLELEPNNPLIALMNKFLGNLKQKN